MYPTDDEGEAVAGYVNASKRYVEFYSPPGGRVLTTANGGAFVLGAVYFMYV